MESTGIPQGEGDAGLQSTQSLQNNFWATAPEPEMRPRGNFQREFRLGEQVESTPSLNYAKLHLQISYDIAIANFFFIGISIWRLQPST